MNSAKFRHKVRLDELPRCAKCDFIGYPEDNFCANCGNAMKQRKVAELIRCPHCRELVMHPITSYCSRCGDELIESNQNHK